MFMHTTTYNTHLLGHYLRLIQAPQHKKVPLVCVKHSEACVTVAHPPVTAHLPLLKHLQHNATTRDAMCTLALARACNFPYAT
jgi:hypothetical protein